MAFSTKQLNTTVTSEPVTVEIKNNDYTVSATNVDLNNTTIDSSGNINAAGYIYLPSLSTTKIPSDKTYKLYNDDIGDLIWQDKNVLIEDDDVTLNSLNVSSLNLSIGGIDYIWPQNNGTGIQVLTTDGNGLLTWSAKDEAISLASMNDTTITSLAANNVLKAELVSGSLKWVNSSSMSGLRCLIPFSKTSVKIFVALSRLFSDKDR